MTPVPGRGRAGSMSPGPSLGRAMPTNADRQHPRVTTPTPLWPGAPPMICHTGGVMPAPGELSYPQRFSRRWSVPPSDGST